MDRVIILNTSTSVVKLEVNDIPITPARSVSSKNGYRPVEVVVKLTRYPNEHNGKVSFGYGVNHLKTTFVDLKSQPAWIPMLTPS